MMQCRVPSCDQKCFGQGPSFTPVMNGLFGDQCDGGAFDIESKVTGC